MNWGLAAGKVAMHRDGTIVPINYDVEAGSIEQKSVENDGEITKKEVNGDNKSNVLKMMFGSRDMPKDIYNVDDEVDERPLGGRQTVRQDAMETLALHLVYVAFSCFFGYCFLRCLWLIEYSVPALSGIKFFTSFPLFPFCMLGGLFVMWVHEKFDTPAPIDDLIMDRIGGASMEFLIVSAISLINTSTITDNIAPLLIIMIGGMTWNFICFFVLAPRMLPDFHFERAIVELGQSFGTTATGLLLLRMTDPEKDTPVWNAFGYKQMMTEPFMGGGLWTTVSLQILATSGVWSVFGIAFAFLCFWTGMYFFYFKKLYVQIKLEEREKANNILQCGAMSAVTFIASLDDSAAVTKDVK